MPARSGRRRGPRTPAPTTRATAAGAPAGSHPCPVGARGDRDPEQAVVDPRPGARADRLAEPVAVVRDQDRRARGVLVAAGAGPAQVEPLALGAEHVGQRVEDRLQLGLAIALALDRLRVEAERDVVDEHAPVDLGEVDPPLATVDERVQRTDDIVAVDAEVEREVVARPRRDAGVGQVELGGDRGDDRLRAVAAGHRQPVGALGDGGAHELLEIAAERQLDRLDPARPCLVGELEALRLAAAGLRVEEQTGSPRRRRRQQAERGRRRPPWRRPKVAERHQPRPRSLPADPPSRITISSDASTRSAAKARPTTRRPLARISPYQAAIAAPIRSAAMIRPRGKVGDHRVRWLPRLSGGERQGEDRRGRGLVI